MSDGAPVDFSLNHRIDNANRHVEGPVDEVRGISISTAGEALSFGSSSRKFFLNGLQEELLLFAGQEFEEMQSRVQKHVRLAMI